MKKIFILLFISIVAFKQPSGAQQRNDDTAKPWVLWYWVKAGVSKEGITADLEAMKEAGIGGAYLASIQGAGNPPLFSPAAEQLSPEWWGMVKHAVAEADRLGLKIGMHVSDGFALAGGPWITPELSMQKIVYSRKNTIGGRKISVALDRPEANADYYKDIAVFAYPSPEGSGISTRTIVPKVYTSTGADATFLVKEGNKEAFRSDQPCWIRYEFPAPFTARNITIRTNGNNYQAQRLLVEVSDDGKTYHSIGRLKAPRHGWQDTDADYTHVIRPVSARYFRFTYDKAGSEPGAEDLDAAKWKPSFKIVNLELSSEPRINQFESKSAAVWRIAENTTPDVLANDLCIPLKNIVNLTDSLDVNGNLRWDAPNGRWTIVRIGHTSTGHTNATAGAGKGLECDKFNPEAVKLQFASWYGEAMKQVGSSLAPRVLNSFYIDSWECGSQNWSPVFREEFQKRRGYDIMPYLLVMAGIPVESAEVSEDVLYDVRKTIAELVVDKFYVTIAALAKEKGVNFSAENVAPTMVSDGILHYKTVDRPMGEFWLNSPTHDKPNDMLDVISGAHIYGKNIIQAEAFTTVRMAWNEYPGMLKTLQDRNYALGVNKLVYHVFTHNPWTDRKPGMTLDGVGLYFQRDQTWWKQGKAWVEYAERCQELLQQGRPVADVAVFTGEELPRRSVLPDRLVPVLPGIFGKDVVDAERKRLANAGEPLRQIPAGVTHSANMADPENWVNPLRGYAYDSFNPDVLSRAVVKDGSIVLESGATYKVLVVPGKMAMNPNYQWMSLEVAKKLKELVSAGATIVAGERPSVQPGLQKGDSTEYAALLRDLWDEGFSASAGQNVKNIGKGKMIKAPYAQDSFEGLGIERDLFVRESADSYAKGVTYTHRTMPGKEIYFIANQQDKERSLEFSFRAAAGSVEIYDPVSNEKWQPSNWKTEKGRILLPLKLFANGSLFVILNAAPKTEAIAASRKSDALKPLSVLDGNWKVVFDAKAGGPSAPVIFKTLSSWHNHIDTLINYYSGTATYVKSFQYKLKKEEQVWLDLGRVANLAEVKVNGISCGIVWTPPYLVDISKAIRKGENELKVEVTNTWANRLMGDQRLPEDKRITRTTAPYRLEGKPLQEAGLFGPVQLKGTESLK